MNWSIKYRPQNYDEIFGHKKVITELKKRIKTKNFSKVVLFSGESGKGKSTLQLICAKSLLCENLTDSGNPCNICVYCNTINKELSSNNFFWFNGSNLGIEEMRSLEQITQNKILGSNQKKVIIIDEMQEIPNVRAQKNILKLLERPDKNTFFILGTMNKSKIDSAILNRSIVYNLDLTRAEVYDCLVDIIKKENVQATIELAKMMEIITNSCNTSLRTAISMLERVVLSEITTEKELYKELGLLSDTKINEIMNYILKGNIKAVETKIDINIYEQIKQRLVLLYKYFCGVELNAWQRGQLQGIIKVNSQVIENSLTILNELTLYPYLNTSIIEFQLIKCIINNKNWYQQFETKVEEPKRVRRERD